MKNAAKAESRQYVMVIDEEPEGGYSGAFPDVPGCFTQGDTMEELLSSAEDALETQIAGLVEEGLSIPEPKHRTAKVSASVPGKMAG